MWTPTERKTQNGTISGVDLSRVASVELQVKGNNNGQRVQAASYGCNNARCPAPARYDAGTVSLISAGSSWLPSATSASVSMRQVPPTSTSQGRKRAL